MVTWNFIIVNKTSWYVKCFCMVCFVGHHCVEE